MRLLEVRDLRKRFDGVEALRGIDLAVEDGEICALIGPNGSGKTTLFAIIGGGFPPTAGSIRFRGQEIAGLPAHRVCRLGIARAFQVASAFLDLPVLENAAIGLRFGRAAPSPEVWSTARALLERVGLGAKALLPARALSLGELRRLEVAMALSTGPRLLLLDEPLAGLSPAVGAEVLRLIREVRAEGTAILLIEHDLVAAAEVADRMVALDQGRIIAEGRPAAVLADPGVAEAYLGGD